MSTLSIRTRSRALAPAGSGVPWATVAALATGLSCTCAFWLVSLQGAIGATERTGTPFATWLMLSVALLPVFGAFTLGALMLSLRWFGPAPRGPWTVLTTAVLLAVGGTFVGLGAIAACSLYDLTLQVRHIHGGVHAMAPCTGGCIPREQHAIFVLHVRGVLLVGRWLLLSNAVLVAWLLAAWGGRIRLATGPTVADPAAHASTVRRTGVVDDVRLLLAGALTSAAVIHAALVPERLGEWPAAAAFFVVLAAAEVGVACVLVRPRTGRLVLLGVAAISVVPLVLWLWSHTLGLPFGPTPGLAETIGVPDAVACALEVTALITALVLLEPRRLVRRTVSAHSRALAGVALVAVTVIAFAATGPSWFDAFGVGASHSTTEVSP